MTPKEKARELVDKFYNIDSDSYMFDGFEMPVFYAQRCALIAVDEILSINNERLYQLSGFKETFYKEVKQEIENL
jgi:hypothetical protein